MKNKYVSQVMAVLSISAAAVATTGCGSASGGVGNMLTGIQVQTYNQNGDLWTSMTSQIDTGAMILAGVTIPIVNPHEPGVVLGQLSMQSNLCNPNGICQGGGTLTIAVNITQVSHAQILDNKLPNGTMIPVGQAVNNAIVALPLGGTGGKLYVAFGQNIAMLGVALPFSALDSVGQYIPGVNIFQPFASNGVSGIIGMFTGSSVKTTGVALFVDLSSLLKPSTSTLAVNAQSSLSSVRAQASVQSAEVQQVEPLILDEVKPSYSKEQAVYYKLWKLNNSRTKLHLK
ncbi:MAG: hypothetical protein ACJ763_08785 [Bdellovibrionia bacterium]